MDNEYRILEIKHLYKDTTHKVGITLDSKQSEFLNDLYNQYGDFSIGKNEETNEIKLITE